MGRRALTNAVLATAALGLGLAAWLVPEQGPRPLTDVDAAAVEQLRITYPDQDGTPSLHLQRRRDGWHLVAPIARPARDGRIVTALALLEARTDACYGRDDRDLERFGLERPRGRLTGDEFAVAFGDRAADGRRYVLAGARVCLVADRAWPLVEQGLAAIAQPGLLPASAHPVRIETPDATVERDEPGSPWRAVRGKGDAGAWAGAWRRARASDFVLDPPAGNAGVVEVRTADGERHRWRLARAGESPILVPAGAGYGLVPESGSALLAPPARDGG